MRSLVIIGLNLLVVASATTAAALSPVADRPVLVVVAPSQDAGQAAALVARVGGALLDRGPTPWTVLARSDDEAFASRLYAAGAIAVVNAVGYAGCSSRGPSS